MKCSRWCVVPACFAGLLLAASWAAAADRAAALPNELFAMDTILFTWKTRNVVQEADVAKIAELGYAGLAPTVGGMGGWNGLPQLLGWLDAKRLKLYAIYTGITVEPGKYSYDPAIKDALPVLKGRPTMLWMNIRSKFAPDDPAAIELAADAVREVADLAAPCGLRVAIYPHVSCLGEHMADAVRIAEKAGRKNVGVTLNLCHWLRADGPDSMVEVMRLALPHLLLVTINGADRDGKNWIQPLDSGTFDLAAFLRQLCQLGYTGPIGVQGFGVGRTVPPYENLARSMAAWKRLSVAAVAPASAATVAASAKAVDWKKICARLKTYTLGQNDDADLATLERCFQRAGAEQRAQIDAALVALLRDPNATADAKRFVCRQGAFLCSDDALAALVELQARPESSFMACYALQRMPNPRVAAALRGVMLQRSGGSRIDVIRVLGGLRDRQAVPLLAGQLSSPDKQLAAAAVAALGAIGGKEADSALAGFEPAVPEELRSAVADARLRNAATMPPEAADLYRHYLKHSSPEIRAAALLGLLAHQPPPQRTPVLLETIRGSDAELKAVALRSARSGGGEDLTRGLTEILEKASPLDQAALLDVLKDRGEHCALPAVLRLTASEHQIVRRAALSAVGRLGDAPQLELLAKAAAKEKGPTQVAARDALALLGGSNVDQRLIALACTGPVSARVEAIGALAARGVTAAMPLLLNALDAPDREVQQAAISALRSLAGAKEYPDLLRRTLEAKSDAQRQRLQGLLVAVYHRSASPQQCVAQLTAALPGATPEGRTTLLAILGSLGDPQALEVLQQALRSADAEQRKTAVVALENWPDVAPVQQLLPIVRSPESPVMKLLAIRTIVAILGRDKTMPNPRKANLLSELLQQAAGAGEKRPLIAALPRAPCPKSLQLAVGLLADKDLHNEAAAAVVGISRGFERAGIRPAEMRAALERAAQAATVPVIQNQVRQQLKAVESIEK